MNTHKRSYIYINGDKNKKLVGTKNEYWDGVTKPDYEYYLIITENGHTRSIFPETLTKKQLGMSVQEYIENGRCEFFKHVRPNHIFKLVQALQ